MVAIRSAPRLAVAPRAVPASAAARPAPSKAAAGRADGFSPARATTRKAATSDVDAARETVRTGFNPGQPMSQKVKDAVKQLPEAERRYVEIRDQMAKGELSDEQIAKLPDGERAMAVAAKALQQGGTYLDVLEAGVEAFGDVESFNQALGGEVASAVCNEGRYNGLRNMLRKGVIELSQQSAQQLDAAMQKVR